MNTALDTMNSQPPQATAAQPTVIMGAGERALATEVDRQVATAKAYPRDLSRCLRKARDMATITPEVAASCYYSLKRKKKGGGQSVIEGPSIRVAEIIMSTWGNIRAQASVIEESERYLVARGVAWDMEANVAASVDVRRNIWGRNGRYKEDMIAVTAQAATSIALRNALLRVVPRVYVDQLVDEARQVAAGNAKSLSSRWTDAVKRFAAMGASEADLLGYLEVTGPEQVTTDHLQSLLGLYTGLREGHISYEEAFAGVQQEEEPPTPSDPAAALKEQLRAQSEAAQPKTKPKRKQKAPAKPDAPAGGMYAMEWAAGVEKYAASDEQGERALRDAGLKGPPTDAEELRMAENALEKLLGA